MIRVKRPSLGGVTAVAALVLAIGAGAVGGALAAGGQAPASAPVVLHQVVDEATVEPTPTATPEPTVTATPEPEPVVEDEPEPVSDPAPIVEDVAKKTETATEAADRATVEADRAKKEADRAAAEVAAKPAPAPAPDVPATESLLGGSSNPNGPDQRLEESALRKRMGPSPAPVGAGD